MHGPAFLYSTFDIAARERIRAKLWAYKRAHGIGFPMLCQRIADATDRRLDWQTLRRFMKDMHRTNDQTLKTYNDFIQMVEAVQASQTRLDVESE